MSKCKKLFVDYGEVNCIGFNESVADDCNFDRATSLYIIDGDDNTCVHIGHTNQIVDLIIFCLELLLEKHSYKNHKSLIQETLIKTASSLLGEISYKLMNELAPNPNPNPNLNPNLNP